MSRTDKGPAVAAAPEPAETPTLTWEYVGAFPRVYTHIPVTVNPGDVIEYPTIPAPDCWWKPSTRPATRKPDNAPEEA